jgi:cobalt/nickel transport system permease protein
MVHISDGVMSLPVLAAGWAIAAILIPIALWWSEKKDNLAEEITGLSMITAAFFVIHPAHFFLPAALFQTIRNRLGNACYLKRNI